MTGSEPGRSMPQMKVGDRVQVRAYKSDGTCYRWWYSTVEAVQPDELTLVTPFGHTVEAMGASWVSKYAIRAYYWPDRCYSLLEAYTPDGRLSEIYVNISSPAQFLDSQVRFVDYELDVSRRPPGEAELVDQDEFQEAVAEYGYSEEFQRACYQVAREALDLANGWVARGLPT